MGLNGKNRFIDIVRDILLWCICRDQMIALGSQFCPFKFMWVTRLELR